MANKFVTALFGDYSKKEIKKLRKTIDKINSLGDKYAEMDDKELTSQTQKFKDRLSEGETLDDILHSYPKLSQAQADEILEEFKNYKIE